MSSAHNVVVANAPVKYILVITGKSQYQSRRFSCSSMADVERQDDATQASAIGCTRSKNRAWFPPQIAKLCKSKGFKRKDALNRSFYGESN